MEDVLISDGSEAELVLLKLQLPSLTLGPSVGIELEKCSYRTDPSQRAESMYRPDGWHRAICGEIRLRLRRVRKRKTSVRLRKMGMEKIDTPRSSDIELLTAMRLLCAWWKSRIIVTVHVVCPDKAPTLASHVQPYDQSDPVLD